MKEILSQVGEKALDEALQSGAEAGFSDAS